VIVTQKAVSIATLNRRSRRQQRNRSKLRKRRLNRRNVKQNARKKPKSVRLARNNSMLSERQRLRRRSRKKRRKKLERKKRAEENKKKLSEAKAKAEQKKQEEAKKKIEEAQKKAEKQKKKIKTMKGSMKLDCDRNEQTGKITCEEIDPETLKKTAKLSDSDDGKWLIAAQRPWPPSNLNIKSWVLVGFGSTNVALAKVDGGVGLPNPSPLVLTFNAGWDSHLTKVIENFKDRERYDGTIYYVTPSGKAVAKLTFERAILAAVRWPKLTKKGKKASAEAKLTLILQPERTVVEKIEDPAHAPDAPEPDNDKLHSATGKDFTLEIDGIDTSQVTGVALPKIVMNMKRSVRYEFDPEAKKQVRKASYKVTGVKPKHLTLYFPKGDSAALKPFRAWKADLHPQPHIGSVVIQQRGESGAAEPMITVKFHGMFVNRVAVLPNRAEVELSFAKMEIDHQSPE